MRFLLLSFVFISIPFIAYAADLSWHLDVGGNTSYIDPSLPKELTIRDKKFLPAVFGGAGLQLRLNDFLRITSGLYYERRACELQGHAEVAILGFIPVSLDGTYNFTYDNIQLPFHAVGVMPMLFPGNIFIGAGPEIGVPLRSTQRLELDSSGTTDAFYDSTRSIKAFTKPFDFGISGEIGYELPFNKILSAGIYAGFYYGLIDIFHNESAAQVGDFEFGIYTRSIRFGLRLDANLFTTRK